MGGKSVEDPTPQKGDPNFILLLSMQHCSLPTALHPCPTVHQDLLLQQPYRLQPHTTRLRVARHQEV